MNYRSEIDGLRALAVIPVILYHAGFGLFSGGFVGVDVFFVISGFLITSIIFEEKKQGTFSISRFYERRARRILPVLLFVIFSTLPFAWALLPPEELKSFAGSVLSVMTFSSNIFFWKESGYFDSAAEFKPLLHTWSLAVEEQYYLLFPIFVACVWRFGTKKLTVILAVILALSFTFAQLKVHRHPETAFYLLPARAWEILIGALAAIYLLTRENKKGSQTLSLIGLGMIVYSIFSFDKNTPFPSFYTLAPTIGAVLIIIFASPNTLVQKILSYKPIVLIGLISYSAYLWHQPIISFTKINNLDELSTNIKILLTVITFVLATLSYKLIETPARKNKNLKGKTLIKAGAIAATPLCAIAVVGYLQAGFPSRIDSVYSASARHNEEMLVSTYTYDSEPGQPNNLNASKPIILILGDSYLKNWSVALNKTINKDKYRIISLSYLGCQANFKDNLIEVSATTSIYEKPCKILSDYINDKKVIGSTEKILLTSFRPFEYGINLFRFELLSTLKKQQPGASIYIFGDYLQLHHEKNPSCLNAMFSTSRDASICKELSVYPKKDTDLTKQEYFSNMTVDYQFIDIVDLHCGYQIEKCAYETNGIPYMYDWNHLTASFLVFLFNDIAKKQGDFLESVHLTDVFSGAPDNVTPSKTAIKRTDKMGEQSTSLNH